MGAPCDGVTRSASNLRWPYKCFMIYLPHEQQWYVPWHFMTFFEVVVQASTGPEKTQNPQPQYGSTPPHECSWLRNRTVTLSSSRFGLWRQTLTLFYSLHRIPRWLLWTWDQLRLLPPWPPVLTGAVPGGVSLHFGLWAWSHGGIGTPPVRRPKVHGHDLSCRNSQPRPKLTQFPSAGAGGSVRRWAQPPLFPGQQF